jgi:lysozyme
MKPRITLEQALKLLPNIDFTKTPVVLLGIRGYYLDSMGVKGKNDRGIYDDALCWITPEGIFAFQANTDPSSYRKGRGTGSSKGMASLNCGTWLYKTGIHNGSSVHPAFRQADKVTVTRDGKDGDYEETGMFGINIHRGGSRGTSSLGCQTIPKAEWDAFKELGYMSLKKYEQKTFPYVLVKNEA